MTVRSPATRRWVGDCLFSILEAGGVGQAILQKLIVRCEYMKNMRKNLDISMDSVQDLTPR